VAEDHETAPYRPRLPGKQIVQSVAYTDQVVEDASQGRGDLLDALAERVVVDVHRSLR
jgi:hypothetical protein